MGRSGGPYERYETERNGFWLNTSLSKNLFSRSHDIGHYGAATAGRGWQQGQQRWDRM